MVLKNFRTLFLLCSCYLNSYQMYGGNITTRITYKDMRGNIQRPNTDGALIGITEAVDWYWYGMPMVLLSPATKSNNSTNTILSQIKDYDNLEDMIKGVEYWGYGTRTSVTHTLPDTSGMIILGSGDTPPTKDDYCLDSWIPTTDLRVENYNCLISYTGDEIGGFQTTFKNMTNENITVKEVGIMKDIFDNAIGSGYDSQRTKVLLVRTVLDNPVIIKPTEIYTFNVLLK